MWTVVCMKQSGSRSNSVHGLTSSTGVAVPGVSNSEARRYPPSSSSSSSSSSSGSAGQQRMCRVYATIREMTSKRSTTVCGGGGGGGGRQKTVHVSVDHHVEIRIINSHAAPKPPVFVLKYEGFYTRLRRAGGGSVLSRFYCLLIGSSLS